MYITQVRTTAITTYILWSDKRKIIMVSEDRNKLDKYMDILIKKKEKSAEFSSWVYMCCRYNIQPSG